VVYVTTVTDKNFTSTNCITNKTCITLPTEVIISQKQTITNIVRDKGLLFSALGCQCRCSKLVPSLFIPTAVDLRVLVVVARYVPARALIALILELVSISKGAWRPRECKLHARTLIAPPLHMRATYSPHGYAPTRVLDANSRASFTLLVICTVRIRMRLEFIVGVCIRSPDVVVSL